MIRHRRVNPLAEALAAQVRDAGPIGYETFVEAALYAPGLGFYETVGRAGRRGSFLTSPEVGPLFGAVLARALAAWWDELDRPDPFPVVEVGAGPGTLARAVLAATAGTPLADALQYVAVERSATQRASHPTGIVSVPTWPDHVGTGVIVANELLDNLAFGLVEAHQGRWYEVRIDLDATGGLVEVRGAAVVDPGWPAAPDGARLPRQDAATGFVHDALARLTHGSLLVLDYAAHEADLVARPWRDWVRTYRDHERGGHPLDDPGTQDVTCEVALDALARVAPPTEQGTQAEFLRAHGLDELVEEGRRVWHDGAATGGLAALKARSRVREADALLDPAGLGGFTALRWVR